MKFIGAVNPLSRREEAKVYYEEWVSKSMTDLTERQAQASEDLRSLFGTGVTVDEMAVMFEDMDALYGWVTHAVRVPGVTLFNTAHDVVTTGPIPGTYNVRYWFLSSPWAKDTEPGEERWRIEAMFAHSGSPLHDSLLRSMRAQDEDAVVVHASFKCRDVEHYAEAQATLRMGGYELVQRCDSTYGKFSYWRKLDATGTWVYLKPRVNLRDTEEEA